MCINEIEPQAQNMIATLGSIVNINGVENLHFGNEYDIHMSS